MVCKVIALFITSWCNGLSHETNEFRVRMHLNVLKGSTRVVPKVMSNFFLHANWEQQKKESVVVDGTSCYVILECLVTSIACIT